MLSQKSEIKSQNWIVKSKNWELGTGNWELGVGSKLKGHYFAESPRNVE